MIDVLIQIIPNFFYFSDKFVKIDIDICVGCLAYLCTSGRSIENGNVSVNLSILKTLGEGKSFPFIFMRVCLGRNEAKFPDA